MILVAGDVFDRAYPPVAAVELYDETLQRLGELGIPAVITSGNHDSPVRLGMGARLGEAAGIHVRTRLDRIAEPITVAGAGGEPGALVYAIPYLDPPTCAPGLDAAEATHAGVLGAAMVQIAADRARRPSAPVIVVAHGVVTGGRPVSESGGDSAERSIEVGGVAAVAPELFSPADYVALGHLHRPQSLAGGTVRYSGAPLPLSFSEAGETKSLSLVELVAGSAPQLTQIPVPQPRALARLRGTLMQLLDDPAHEGAETAWVEATLTDPLRPKQAMDRLRARFPHVIKLEHDPERAPGEGAGHERYADRVRGRTDLQIAERFLADVRGGIAADPAEQALLREALESQGRQEAGR